MALVVVAVAEQDDGSPRRAVQRLFQQLVAAGIVERIVKRGASPRPQLVDTVIQFFGVIGKILRHFRSGVEAHNKRQVITLADCLIEKFDGRFLLELEAVANRTAGIDQQTDLQR